MATIKRKGDGLMEIRYEKVSVIPQTPKRVFKSKKQYCCEASDNEIWRQIRAMDDRERLIVARELLRIYDR